MTRRQFIPFAIVALCLLASPQLLLGQRTSTGGSSLFGSSGGGIGSSGGLGGSSFGGGAAGGLGQGGFGQGGGLGQSGLGQGGLGQFGGAQSGGFIGRDSGEVSDFFGSRSPFGANAGGQGDQTRGAMNRGRGINEQESSRPPILVKVSLGFTPPTRPFEYADRATTSRLNGLVSSGQLGDARVSVVDGVATISGIVTSESQRLVLTRLARLEPGVKRVDDQTLMAASEELPSP